MEAGTEAMAWIQQIMGFEMEARGMGFPTAIGGAAKAPFDILADTMRGTRATMVDMYRQPDMVLKAWRGLLPCTSSKEWGWRRSQETRLCLSRCTRGGRVHVGRSVQEILLA